MSIKLDGVYTVTINANQMAQILDALAKEPYFKVAETMNFLIQRVKDETPPNLPSNGHDVSNRVQPIGERRGEGREGGRKAR